MAYLTLLRSLGNKNNRLGLRVATLATAASPLALQVSGTQQTNLNKWKYEDLVASILYYSIVIYIYTILLLILVVQHCKKRERGGEGRI